MRDAPDTGSPGRTLGHAAAIAAIAAPIAVAQLSQMAMALTDTLMLGRIGPAALSAGGLGANLFFTSLWALQGVISGVSVLTARARGANQPETIPATYWSGIAIAGALAIPFFWLMSVPGPLLRAAGETPALIQDIGSYLSILRWGVPAGLLGIGIVRAFLPAIGLERLLLWVIPAGVALNFVLNVWLIYGGLGVPPLGMRGSAAATAITMWVSALSLTALLHFHRHWRHHVRLHKPQSKLILELLAIGFPVAVTVMVEATLFLATGLLVGALGQVPLAAHMVAISAATVTFMVPMAISQAANVRVSHEIGAGNPRAARRAGFTAIAMAACFMGATALIMLLVPGTIASLYLGAASPALPLAAALLRIAGAFQIFDGIQVTASGALRGLKDTRVPMVLAAIGYWGIGFFLGRHLAFAEGLGARGLWWGLCVGLAAVAISLTARFALATRTGIAARAMPQVLRHPA
jgi:multidrug resistance protein, MATE family